MINDEEHNCSQPKSTEPKNFDSVVQKTSIQLKVLNKTVEHDLMREGYSQKSVFRNKSLDYDSRLKIAVLERLTLPCLYLDSSFLRNP
uniref:Uncharacterized protein n=1 Tax=Romanomermis culicivorax TaxID=13658 RepID=A0A915IKA7_ROMCU